MLDAAPCEATFTPRPRGTTTLDRHPTFQPPESGTDGVRVRFASGIARWLAERYPDHEQEPDGSVIVTFDVASVEWLVRHVLQYGAAAEVLSPVGYREAVREAVA
jgi:predicted DNA-binding transcriptional regulator YafY